MTYDEVVAELVKVDAAIDKILEGAQEYGIAGRNIKRPDLNALYARKKELESLKKKLNPDKSIGGSVRYPLFGTR